MIFSNSSRAEATGCFLSQARKKRAIGGYAITTSTSAASAADSRGLGRSTHRDLWISLSLLTAAWLLLCWPWLIGGLIIPWDAKNHFYPILRFVAQSLHSDQSPFWNPYHMGGHPMISDPQSMLFSPLMIGLAALVDKPSMHLVDAVQLLHLLIGGAGIVLLCRSYRWHAAAGLAAALVFMFGGSAAARLQHTGMILSYSYLPICLLLLKEALDRASIAYGAAFGLLGAILAANRDQVAYLGCLILIGYGLHRVLTAEARGAFLKTRWPAVAAATVTGVLGLAVPLVLTLELLNLSNRPTVSYAAAATGSLAPVNFITMLAPDYFKSVSTMTDYWGPGGRAWDMDDWCDRAVTYLYSGLLPVVLLAWYGLLAGWIRSREVRFFAVVLGAAVIYALGKHTPAFHWLFGHFPGVDLYRRPADATFIINFALAMTSGYLLDRLLREGAPARLAGTRLLVAIGAGIAVFATFAVIAIRHGEQQHGLQTLALAVLCVAGTAFVLRMIGRDRPRQPMWVAVALLLLAFDLRIHNTGAVFNAQDPRQLASFEGDVEGNAVAAVLHQHLEQAADRMEGPYRAEILGLGGIWQNAPMIFNIEATLGYNPLRLESYEAATGANETSHESRRRFSTLMRSYRSTLANLLGIRFICTTVPIETIDPSLKPGDFKVVDQVGRVRIYENPRAFPRVFVAEKAQAVDTEAVLHSGVMPAADFRSTVLLDPLPRAWNAAAADAPTAEKTIAEKPTAFITDYDNTEVKVKVKVGKPSFLVLNDLYYPYWHAYVDGKETELLNANILFRSVLVPAGEHEVVFRFEPLSWQSIVTALKE